MESAATTASSLEAEQDSVNAVRLNLLLPVLVYAARHSFNAVMLNLLLPILVYAARHSLTAVRHKLMLPGITFYYWFCTSAKVKTVTGERQIQALVDKKKVIIYETSIRSDLKLDDAKGFVKHSWEGTDKVVVVLGAKIPYWSGVEAQILVFMDKQVEGMTRYKEVYVTPSHTKKVFANMKRSGKGFSRRATPLFLTTMIQASKYMGEELAAPSDSHSTPIISQPSSTKPQKKNLQEKVLDLEKAKTAQAKKITSLKKRVKQLEKRRKSRTSGIRSEEIEDLDADAEVTLVNETQEMNDDILMFDTGVLEEQEIEFEKVVEEHVVSIATTKKSIPVSAAEVVPIASASVEILDELTLAQTLIEIKIAKPKPVTTIATTVTSVKPRAKGIIIHAQEEQVPTSTKTFSSSQSQLPQVKDKGKEKMVEPEVPLKKKDQVALDEEMA
ncbi:hypothetical protein Tco_1225088 [Tanacetum coccineum]